MSTLTIHGGRVGCAVYILGYHDLVIDAVRVAPTPAGVSVSLLDATGRMLARDLATPSWLQLEEGTRLVDWLAREGIEVLGPHTWIGDAGGMILPAPCGRHHGRALAVEARRVARDVAVAPVGRQTRVILAA